MNRKIKKIAWTDGMIKIIADNCKTKSASEIANMINSAFGTNKSENAIHKKANIQGFKLSAVK